ncbi:Conserved_hypothetical protein [Hexamita inflata]|uniref:Uncharacterized protein n=1 Tax=Hexamita inflata TaxID=28002 RepID=A0AA86Q062_9EUKA|nr:Conserved hypothetical protein [Hexamita inflata]CAI9947377.1 Conserved hypothetical protein [Hexamita inflata]
MKAHKFELAMSRVIRDINKITVTEPKAIFDAFGEIPCRKNIWLLVSDYYGCIPQEAHDYYHNIWSKQFSDSFQEMKPEIDQLVAEQLQSQPSKATVTKMVIQLFLAQHPDKSFHKLSLNQYVHHQINRSQKTKEKAQKSEISNTQVSNTQSEVTVSDIQMLLKNISLL